MFGAVLKYRGATPKLAARVRNQVQKEGIEKSLSHWHAHMRPKHFTHEGAREYGYTPRQGERGSQHRFKGSYTQRKLQKFGHTRPLEFSGTSKALSANKNIKATSKGGRCKINAPALNFKHPNSTIVMRDEMTRVTRAEASEIAEQVFQPFMAQRFEQLTASATETKTV